jgi:hypothetical protein
MIFVTVYFYIFTQFKILETPRSLIFLRSKRLPKNKQAICLDKKVLSFDTNR